VRCFVLLCGLRNRQPIGDLRKNCEASAVCRVVQRAVIVEVDEELISSGIRPAFGEGECSKRITYSAWLLVVDRCILRGRDNIAGRSSRAADLERSALDHEGLSVLSHIAA